MSVFCLVHGSVHGPEGWDLLAGELRRRGAAVVTPDLPTERPDAGAGFYADRIARALDRSVHDPGEVEVVGHSQAGLFLPLIAEHRPVARLVFLAALIPEVGSSMREQIESGRSVMNPDWIGRDPRDPETAEQFLLHDCDPTVVERAREWIEIRYARGAMAECFPLQSFPDVPTRYVVCRDDRTIRPAWSRRVARERLQVEPEELTGGHCPHWCRPAELAELLVT